MAPIVNVHQFVLFGRRHIYHEIILPCQQYREVHPRLLHHHSEKGSLHHHCVDDDEHRHVLMVQRVG